VIPDGAGHIDHPFHVDGRGRTATTGEQDHLRDLIEQVILTAPGERVMRPGFGSGLLGLPFEPAGPELLAATEYLVSGALQQWLADRITVGAVEVAHDEGTLSVTVRYVVVRTGDPAVAEVRRSVP
jgi:uncharacterized protein